MTKWHLYRTFPTPVGPVYPNQMLHLLGIDHKRLTVYHNGIQRRLTNIDGRVIREVLA